MRLDKFLKLSRLIKRRTVANKVCSAEKIYLNEKLAKPSAKVKINDIITINLGTRSIKVKVVKILESTKKEDAEKMYEVM